MVFQTKNCPCIVFTFHFRTLKSTTYTNSLVNSISFYANFTITTFQKIPIPYLTRTMKCGFYLILYEVNYLTQFFPRTKCSVNQGVGVLIFTAKCQNCRISGMFNRNFRVHGSVTWYVFIFFFQINVRRYWIYAMQLHNCNQKFTCAAWVVPVLLNVNRGTRYHFHIGKINNYSNFSWTDNDL